MQKASIHLTRMGQASSHDDVITILECEDTRDLFKVIYKTPDYKKRKAFVASEHRVLDYIDDILASMRHDADPFEYAQVDTVIHPPILYHVSDLDDKEVRSLILTVIRTAMRMDVENE